MKALVCEELSTGGYIRGIQTPDGRAATPPADNLVQGERDH